MKFSQSEWQTLAGPAVVGVTLGTVFTVCILAFNSEYNAAALSNSATVDDTMLTFFGGFCLTLVSFGLVPVLIERLRLGAGNKTKINAAFECGFN